MPELPEVESLRRALAGRLTGCTVRQANLLRTDVLHRQMGAPAMPLPEGARVKALHRHGKQMAIETHEHGCMLVHLGMSGSLRVMSQQPVGETHVHACWQLRAADGCCLWLRHRDPRRFGWLESHADMRSIRTHGWHALGPDALDIDGATLHERLRETARPLKAALLDQACVAGLGNIYVDESLFRARLHPRARCHRLAADVTHRLAGCIRQVLQKAVELGGSTIQDHRNADGTWGSFQRLHHVYGRSGEPCHACGLPLRATQVSQRTTVFCGRCQFRR